MHHQPHHLAIGGRFDQGARQIICHCYHFLRISLHLTAHLRHLGFHLFSVLLLASQFALRQFGNGLPCPHRLPVQIKQCGLQVSLRALKLQQAVAWHIAIGHQWPGLAQLLLQQPQLRFATLCDGDRHLNRGCQAPDVFIHRSQFSRQSGPASPQQVLLRDHLRGHQGITFRCQ